MEDWRKNRIESAKNGTNPMLMIETNGGYSVFGDTQFLHGHVFPRYEWESEERKSQYGYMMSLIGLIVKNFMMKISIKK
ncbi:hypothetical protein [Paraclostridium tenue]|uniref:Uncharacterized protein n=1 Tax=Paraclostridium tenue TaxID=1737 RepID=A0ABP3XE47_9FIRM